METDVKLYPGVRAVGFEPTASGLKVRCSTTELRPRSGPSSQSVHRVRPSREGPGGPVSCMRRRQRATM